MKKILLIASAVLLLGAGCIQVKGTSPTSNDGGLWGSADKGKTWTQSVAIAVVGPGRTYGPANVTRVAFDPSDNKAIYVGTEDRGLLYTYDLGAAWREVPALGAVRVNAVAVSPANKCLVFVATGNRIVRSYDCLRTWDNAYVDTRTDTSVTDLDIDFYTPSVVWATTAAGDLIKSVDSGSTWKIIKRFDGNIRQLLMSASDSRVLWISIDGKSLWKTADAGANWVDLSPRLNGFKGVYDTVTLADDRATPNSLVIASRYGLLRTRDAGVTWQTLPLLTPTGGTTILSLAVNPRDSNEIWYGTANTLYHSADGGTKWNTSKLPTSRAATTLTINPNNPGVLYLGTTLFQKKQIF